MGRRGELVGRRDCEWEGGGMSGKEGKVSGKEGE